MKRGAPHGKCPYCGDMVTPLNEAFYESKQGKWWHERCVRRFERNPNKPFPIKKEAKR